MDKSTFIYGLLILFGLLCLQSCGAEISLKLQNERRPSRRDYIPTASNTIASNIIVKEEIYQVQEQIQPVKHFSHHQEFLNSNSDSSRYQIFEVHNHYEAPTIRTNSAQHATEAADYLPPPVTHEEEIHLHTTSTTNANSPSSYEDDNLDVSYVTYGSRKFEPHAPQHASPQTVSSTHGVAASISSSYPHVAHGHRPTLIQSSIAQPPAPTHVNIHQQQQTYPASNYPPSHITTQKVQSPPAKLNYMAPPYLPPPPHVQHHGIQQHQHYQQQQQQQHLQYQQHQLQQHHQLQQQHQQHQHISPAAKQSLKPLSYAGPSYLPPAHGQVQQGHLEIHGQAQREHVGTHDQAQQGHVELHGQAQQEHVGTHDQAQQGHVATHRPAHSQATQGHVELHGQAQQGHVESQHQNNHQYRAPGYLPPGYDFANPQEHSQRQPPAQHEQQQIPGHLPSGYDFNNPKVHHQQEHHAVQEVPNVPMQEYRAPGYLPPSYNMQSHQQSTQYVSNDAKPTAATGNELPDGYDFTKPDNAEEAIAELHSLQTQTMLLNQQGNQIPNDHGSSTNSVHGTGDQTTSQQQQQYHGAPYLPPSPTALHTLNGGHQQQIEQHHGAPYLPPSPTALHTLNGGHQQQVDQHYDHHQTAIDVTPIYRDHQMVSYAPTQPDYVPQKRLQTLMPKDVVSASVQPKVRTIQIIKPNAIKTLKVLETLAHDGVKTIKILGPSQGQPTGTPQQVVNVISQQASHDISQVIKVFNDEHQESAIPQSSSSSSSFVQQQQQQQLTNGYLPPAINHRRNLARQKR